MRSRRGLQMFFDGQEPRARKASRRYSALGRRLVHYYLNSGIALLNDKTLSLPEPQAERPIRLALVEQRVKQANRALVLWKNPEETRLVVEHDGRDLQKGQSQRSARSSRDLAGHGSILASSQNNAR